MSTMLSREDDQILALNYENLVDVDYLNKLFNHAESSTAAKDEPSSTEQAKSSSENGLSTSEFPEDVIIFGDNLPLGRSLFDRRLNREWFLHLKFQDSLSQQIFRQSVVYERMNEIVVRNFQKKINSRHATNTDEQALTLKDRSTSGTSISVPLLLTALDLDEIDAADIKEFILSFALYFDPTLWPQRQEILTSYRYLDEIRRRLYSFSVKATSSSFLSQVNWNKTAYSEEIQLSLYSAYGLLALGLLRGEVADVVIAMDHLMQLLTAVEARSELLLERLLHTAPAPSLIAPSKTMPSKGAKKAVASANRQESTTSEQRDRSESLMSDDDIFSPTMQHEKEAHTSSTSPRVVVPLAIITEAIEKPSTASKQGMRDGSKQTSFKPFELAKDKDNTTAIKGTKGKPSKHPQESQKLLVDMVESKEMMVAAAVGGIIISNHATMHYDHQLPSPVEKLTLEKKQGSSNHLAGLAAGGNSSSSNVLKGNTSAAVIATNASNVALAMVPPAPTSSTMFTPRTVTKRFDKEVKDAMAVSLHVPNVLLKLVYDFGSTLSKTGVASSTTKSTAADTVQKTPSKDNNKSTATATSSSPPHKAKTGNKNSSAGLTSVHSCGQNSYGELGLGDINMRKSFAKIAALDDKIIISIGAGNEHSLFVTRSGKLYTAGYNDNGQCGIGSTQQVKHPTLVNALEDEELQQVFVFNGCEHTIVVSREGKVFSFGYNYRGQLGLGTTNSESIPRPVRALMSRKVVIAACSYHHSIFLCSDGSLFACGRNDSGQLGHGDTVDKKIPQAILSAPRHVVSLSCGQFHTVISTVPGAVYVCGKNDYGQLGVDGSNTIKVLSKISVPAEMDTIQQVCCGYYHTLLLSGSGVTAGFGRNDYGQLGLSHSTPKVFQCAIINHLRDKGVVSLAAGCYHSIAVTTNGMLYVFGRNNHGQLATGDLDERHTPHPVDDFVGQRILAVSAGFYHTIVLTSSSDGIMPSDLLSSRQHEFGTHPIPPEHDPKQKSTLFVKDLQLIGADFAASSAARLDQLSSTSSIDLLTVLVKNLGCFVDRFASSSSSSSYRNKTGQIVDNKSIVDWAIKALSSLNTMLETSWATITGNMPTMSFLAVAPDEQLGFLCRIVALCSAVLENFKPCLVEALRHEKDEILGFEQHEFDIGTCSMIPYSSALIAGTEKSLARVLPELRAKIFGIYFRIHKMDPIRGETEVYSTAVCDLILRCYSCLFSQPSLVLNFLIEIRSILYVEPESSLSNERAAYVKLICAIGRVYCSNEESRTLFESSVETGMEIFRELNQVYNSFSRRNVERRIQSQSIMLPIESKRLINTLEQGISSLLKMAIPLIFTHDSSALSSHNSFSVRLADDNDGRLDGIVSHTVIIEMIVEGSKLLELVLSKPITEENLGLLRYGTVLPSILPTIFLSSIAYARSNNASNDTIAAMMAEPLKHMIAKLERICRWETATLHAKLLNDRKVSTESVTSIHPRRGIANLAGSINALSATATTGDGIASHDRVNTPIDNINIGSEEISESLLEEILYVKKEQSQVSWWFRLLKLAVTLLSKLNAKPVSVSNAIETSRQTVDEKMVVQFKDLSRHRVWRHLLMNISTSSSLTASSAELLVSELDWRGNGASSAPLPAVSAIVNEVCQRYRDGFKARDHVYRMLLQSSQSSLSGSVLHMIEDRLFACFSSMRVSFVDSIAAEKDLFKRICKVSKLIYSKRSLLVSNAEQAGGMSWPEILLYFERLFYELCEFVTSCYCPYRSLVPLPIVTASKSKLSVRWKKVLLLVLCANRWIKVANKKSSSVMQDGLDFVMQAMENMTAKFSDVPSLEYSSQFISTMIASFHETNRGFDHAASSISSAASFYSSVTFITLKSDMIMTLSQVLRDSITLCGSGSSTSLTTSLSSEAYHKVIESTKYIDGIVRNGLESWLTSSTSAFTLIDLQLVNNLIKLQEVLHMFVVHFRGDSATPIPFKVCVNIVIKLYEKYQLSYIAAEEKKASNRKGSTQRERIAMCKKAAFSVLSCMHSVITSYIDMKTMASKLFLENAIDAYNTLLAYLQTCRNEESAMSMMDDNLVVNQNMNTSLAATSTPGLLASSTTAEATSSMTATIASTITLTLGSVTGAAVKDSAAGSSAGNLLPVVPSINAAARQLNKEAGKNRCQDLITRPMEFSHSCEGVVVAGEKLLNNLKGTDFSMASWIFVTTYPTGSKTSFIMGRLSNNEAWPLLLMRSEGKLEVNYGQNSEMEKLQSETVIPLFTWIHIALVIEQKKIKLFINGSVDNQVSSTKGHARAVMFPLLIGTCPSQVRTRIASVKDGFDGLVSNLKYYSRALSPIHVKVIYDHGPPELTDVGSKMVYQTLASLRCIFESLDNNGKDGKAVSRCLELCHLVFVTDNGRRNRYAALKLMQYLLCKYTLHSDFALTAVSHRSSGSGSLEKIRSIALSQSPFQAGLLSERFVLYLVRMIGMNWLQYIKAAEDVVSLALQSIDDPSATSSLSAMEEMSSYAPRGCFNKAILDKINADSRTTTPSNSITDRLLAQEEPYGETSYQLITCLHTMIASHVTWQQAANTIISSVLSTFAETMQKDCGQVTRLNMIDLAGVSLLLGNKLQGSYLGSQSSHFFDEKIGQIVQINTTVGGAIVLTSTADSNTIKASKIRLNDLTHTTDVDYDQTTALLVRGSSEAIMSCLEQLSPALKLLTRDFLSANSANTNAYQQKAFLRCLRPLESFSCLQLLSSAAKYIPEMLTANLTRYTVLTEIVKESSYASLELDLLDKVRNNHKNRAGNGGSCQSLTYLWFQSMHYFSMLPEKAVKASFPTEQEERALIDYVNRQLGLQDDVKTIGRQVSTGGMLTKAMLANINMLLESFDISQFESNYLLNDRSYVSRSYAMTFDSAFTEQDCSNAWMLLQYMRHLVVQTCRVISRQAVSLSSALTSPAVSSAVIHNNAIGQDVLMIWKILLSSKQGAGIKWIDIESLRAILQPDSAVHQALVRFNANANNNASNSIEDAISSHMAITNFFATTIKFAASSMLLPAAYKSNKENANILLSTDFFSVLTRQLYLWLEFTIDNNVDSDFSHLMYVTLGELLPCISFSESGEIKNKILQICVFFVRRLLTKVLHGYRPSKGVMEVVRSNHFNVIRTFALDQVFKYRGHNQGNISHHAYNLTQLVAVLELIQRRACAIEHQSLLRMLTASAAPASIATNGSSFSSSSGPLAKIQSHATNQPRLVTVRATHFDADLSPCAASIRSTIESNQELLAGYENLDMLGENIVVEVALGVVSAVSSTTSSASSALSSASATAAGATNAQDCVFETIYCGSSMRLLQSGLMPDCNYQLRCRAYLGSVPLAWSAFVEFHTEKGPLFSFDSLKCGPDIVLSEDSMTASFTGDDTWSTVLANRSFSSGVTSWEMKINSSSTAYIFVGVATSAADLSSFLGGCEAGWGFIGEQALYHNREKVKVYGEPFTTGDVIGVTLDLTIGTLSFTKNKKSLGIAFDKIFGDLLPAVAFYNVGQEISIIADGFKTSCTHESIPISPSRLSMDDISLLNELVLCLYTKATLSHRLAVMIAEHCNQWSVCTHYTRHRTVSKKEIFLATDPSSPLLKRFNLIVGERVRTYFGVAEVAGAAYNRVWFKVNELQEVWFCAAQQIAEGKAKKGLFLRSTYETAAAAAAAATVQAAANTASSSGAMTFDANSILDLLDPSKWSVELDSALSSFLQSQASKDGLQPWQINAEHLLQPDNFRSLQQVLNRVVLSNAELTHKWGIAGPKRKAAIARCGLLRILNQMLDMYLPFMISDHMSAAFTTTPLLSNHFAGSNENNSKSSSKGSNVGDDFAPQVETFVVDATTAAGNTSSTSSSSSSSSSNTWQDYKKTTSGSNASSGSSSWPSVVYSWDYTANQRLAMTQELWIGPLPALRRLLFTPLKVQHFLESIRKTTTRPAKTEDDYDYPDNLPHVKINRLKAFRAREIADMLHINGDDLLLSTMFCQLWKELRASSNSTEKLRISYTHPMDDGQARSFKIKFEGEGVDDYGGPYREIFQQICTELQLTEPLPGGNAFNMDAASSSNAGGNNTELVNESVDLSASMLDASISSLHPMDLEENGHGGLGGMLSAPRRCFLPLLMPTPNWSFDGDCVEKYKFMFHVSPFSSSTASSASSSPLQSDLFLFMGQLVGLAIRSRITLDLAFPSFIWRAVVNERLTENDLASFDQAAYDLVKRLSGLYASYQHEVKQQQAAANAAAAIAAAAAQQQQLPVLMTPRTSNANATATPGDNRSISAVSNHEEFGLDALDDLTWCATRSDGTVIDLIEDGRHKPVCIEELGTFLTLYVDCRLQENQHAIQLFRTGLVSIIPESSIALLNNEELEHIVCGSKTIDIERLRANTEYDDDVGAEDEHITHFWEVLEEFSEAEKSAFLKFVWARPSLPPTGVDFTQKMRILSSGSSATGADDGTNKENQDLSLPKSHTCFFSINLPKYSSKKIMAEKLRYAILNCTEMDGDFRTTEADVPGWMNASLNSVASASGLDL